MTDKQKAAFLRSEGWVDDDGIWYPRAQGGPALPIDEAFRIASRRKAARERALLKRAGYEYGECIFYGFGWFDEHDHWVAKTRAEAIEKARWK